MAIKVDFEKAYDRLRWDFILDCLYKFGIPQQIIDIIMCSVTSISFKIIWNGCKTESFEPCRGLRQGNPISSYLFVIAMDKLSQAIEERVELGVWKPMVAGRNGPSISHLLFADDLLLFVEASVEQIRMVREVITAEGGFEETPSLGRYLGALITNSRKGRDRFKTTLERVAGKLQGWKASCLSFARRVTLAKAVISPVVNFDMMHSSIPKAVCREIEKMQRKFIWGEEEGQRKMHAVSWKQLCRAKNSGGLGFRDLTKMNEAFLSKVDLVHDMQAVFSDSILWKELTKVGEFVRKHVRFSIGDGSSTLFRKDRWLKDERPLLNHVSQVTRDMRMNMYVSEAVREGNWNYSLLQNFLEEDRLQEIRVLVLPAPELGKDSLKWDITHDGNFTVASAYKALARSEEKNDDIWKLIWQWPGPERIKCFMWLVVHRKIMTAQRRRQIFGTNDKCHACPGIVETLEHVLRDCSRASHVWSKTIHHSHIQLFFRAPFNLWIR
ncbi:hypothetical protein AHAS_Ahas05G0094400 [Arachis hypogaea]